MKLRPNFRGSVVALVFGALMILSALSRGAPSRAIPGVVTILGALAYRSAKQTKLGLATAMSYRTAMEALAVVAILTLALLGRDVLPPVPHLTITAWAILAYLAARTGTASTDMTGATAGGA
jgi:hypothetical protein